MATTYERIRAVLRYLESEPREHRVHEVAASLRQLRLPQFRLRGDGSSQDDFMSETAIRRLLGFTAELGLIRNTGDRLPVRRGEFQFLADDGSYARKIDQATKNYLSSKGLALSKIRDTIDAIQPPEVPDAFTIYDRLTPEALGLDAFARALFLLACSGVTIRRSIHVHYSLD